MSIDQQDLREQYGTEVDRPAAEAPRSSAPNGSVLGRMGVLVLPIVWLVAWALALTNVHASGFHVGQGFTVNAIRWMLYLPAGWMFIVSGVMHTKFAKRTASLIGWETNGFQYELGFVCFGLGIAGVYASTHGSESWIALTIPTTTFLVFAGINHVVEIVRDHNFNPGNTFVCISDFGVPISLWALLFAAHIV